MGMLCPCSQKAIKLSAWEEPFLKQLLDARDVECAALRRFRILTQTGFPRKSLDFLGKSMKKSDREIIYYTNKIRNNTNISLVFKAYLNRGILYFKNKCYKELALI